MMYTVKIQGAAGFTEASLVPDTNAQLSAELLSLQAVGVDVYRTWYWNLVLPKPMQSSAHRRDENHQKPMNVWKYLEVTAKLPSTRLPLCSHFVFKLLHRTTSSPPPASGS